MGGGACFPWMVRGKGTQGRITDKWDSLTSFAQVCMMCATSFDASSRIPFLLLTLLSTYYAPGGCAPSDHGPMEQAGNNERLDLHRTFAMWARLLWVLRYGVPKQYHHFPFSKDFIQAVCFVKPLSSSTKHVCCMISFLFAVAKIMMMCSCIRAL